MTTRPLWLASLLAGLLGSFLLAAPASAISARDYGRDLAQHPDDLTRCAGPHRGEVTLELRVSDRGRLTGGRVTEGEGPLREVGACVLRAARGWTFQRSTSGGGGRYVLSLRDDGVAVRSAR